ncbi:MAG: hypothetical protein JJT94_14325, partial [Bernardetiaceae bacterium]|nr:hypothetical protein [Bernardetiaceae bacterium]
MKISTLKSVIIIALCLISYLAEAQVRYVKPTATGTGDGSSWANASNDLQAMINASAAGEQVWVAAGTYKPTQYPTGCGTCTNPRQYTFSLKSGVEVYGGFVGTETMISQRTNFAPTEANETILSGDLADNDDFDTDNKGYQGTTGDDNVFHVVTSTFTVTGHTTILDGFSIIGGHANVGTPDNNNTGAGLYATSVAGSTQIYRNNSIYHNQARRRGAGIDIFSNVLSGDFVFEHNNINDNICYSPEVHWSTSYSAPGIHADNRGGTWTFEHNHIFRNKNLPHTSYGGAGGGGRFLNRNNGALSIINNHIYENINIGNGNRGAGLHISSWESSSLDLINNHIYGNNGNLSLFNNSEGGGIYIFTRAAGPHVITDNTFHSNRAARGGAFCSETSHQTTTGTSYVFSRNEVYDNQAGNGGGLYVTHRWNLPFIMEENLFYNNTATGQGGALWCDNVSRLFLFNNNEVYDNQASSQGGGLRMNHSTNNNFIYDGLPNQAIITNNQIYGNTAGSGGGMHVGANAGGFYRIENNTIYDNIAQNNGGGLQCALQNFTSVFPSEAIITNNTIYNNSLTVSTSHPSLGQGGGISIGAAFSSIAEISNNEIYGNTATARGGGVAMRTGGVSSLSSHSNVITLVNNNIYNNSCIGLSARGGGVNSETAQGSATQPGINNILNNNIYNNYSSRDGGGIYTLTRPDGSNVTFTNIINNSIRDNEAGLQGGGVYSHSMLNTPQGSQRYINNRIENNTAAQRGGGVYVEHLAGSQLYTNNTVLNNSSSNQGGGFYSTTGNTQTFNCINNTIYNNTASTAGGGLYAINTSAGATQNYLNNIFWENQQNGSNDVAGADVFRANATGTVNVEYCIVQANTLYTPSGVNNNIFQDPLFVDAAAGNLRLQTSSIAVDSGSDDAWAITGLDTDKDGEERPKFCVVDRGAFELQ